SAIDRRLSESPGARCFWWDGKWYSKSDFSGLADECEASLRDSGFDKGQRLVVLMQNCPMLIALSLAVWRIGGTIAPLNVKSGVSSLRATLELIEPFAIAASGAIRDEAEDMLRGNGFSFVACGPMGPLPPLRGRPSSVGTPDTAVLFATSGTTGLPKAVPLSHGNIYDNSGGLWEAIRALEPGDVILNVLPNFHSFAYTLTMMMPLLNDAAVVMVPGFIPPHVTVNAIREAGVNVIFGVPTIFSYLLSGMERKSIPRDLFDPVKIMMAGGDRLGDNLHEQSKRLTGKDILEGYGLTETSPGVAVSRSYEEYRPGTVGPFLRGYEWRLRTERGDDTDKDEGVLWVRGPSVAEGYFRAPEITSERFKGGWFNTGDYVRIENGYVRILDRVTDIIIVGGFNVYPQEVELTLHGHPAIQTAVVVGMPHLMNGEVPKAFVLKAEGAEISEAEIIKYCKKRLAHFKVPRKVEFVDEFPLSPAGKILRRILRERERENKATA
ncbi:MAG: AMP-binding protein, partial [Synergistaceae bacterium]|nr:AMP-binding protein [Synergistaceae bacterium]